jgi:hypothetical protein
MIHEVFIIPEPYHFDGVKELESYFLLMVLIGNKYLLHDINKEKNISYTSLIK